MFRSKIYYGYIIVFLAFITMSVQWSVIYSFGVFFKPLLAEFGWSRAATSAAFSIYSPLSGVAAIYAGWLNDRIGPRFVMSVCAILVGAGAVLVSHTRSLPYFYLSFGGVMGLAMSGQFIPLMSTVARWFTAKRGAMSGIVAAGVGIGALIGPQVSNQLMLHLGWRAAFQILGLTAAAVMLVCAQFLRQEPGPGEAVDAGTTGHRALRQAQDDPLTHRQAARSARYWLLMLTSFSYGYCLFSLTVHVVAHATDTGVSATTAVGLLTIFGGLSVLGKISFGRLADRIGCTRTMCVGFCMVTVAYAGLILAQNTWAIYMAVGIFGFFYGSITVTQSPLTAILFGLKSHGLILGVVGTSVTLGGAVGPYLTGYIFDLTGSYRPAFMVSAGVAFLGAVAAARIRQPRIIAR
jgi:MFS family permease